MKRGVKLGIIIALSLFLALSLIPAAEARTVVSRSNCDITITVFLAFAFGDDASWANAQQLVNIWVAGMLAVWNEPDFTYGLCDCPVHFEVDVKIVPKGQNCMDVSQGKVQGLGGYHCIDVVNQPRNGRGNVADAHEVPPDGSWNGYGTWTTGTTGMNAAHEVGHLMGLGDEYHYGDTDGDGQGDTYVNDNPQPAGQAQSIMAQTWGAVAALQSHIDEIVGDAGVDCPVPECCCGNGEHDAVLGEECDPTATPSGCPEGQTCNSKCKCVPGPVVTPICGDGHITKPKEECDPKAKPTGCAADEDCVGCKCKKKTTVEITDPKDGAEVEEPVNVTAHVESDLDIEEVRFYVDDDKVFTDDEGPYEWEFDPSKYAVGEHEIRVKAYDEEGNIAVDEIEITIPGIAICGNGKLEPGEICEPPQFVCGPGFNCVNCQCIPFGEGEGEGAGFCGDGVLDYGEECEVGTPCVDPTMDCIECLCLEG